MPINKTSRVGFVHIPKCGGTSIEVAIGVAENYPRLGLERTPTAPDYDHLFGGGLQHLSAREMRQSYTAQWNTLNFVFSVVRDPVDRFLSQFCWEYYRFQSNVEVSSALIDQLAERVAHLREQAEKSPLFNSPLEGIGATGENGQSIKPTDPIRHLLPQASYLHDQGQLVVERLYAIENMPALENDLRQRRALRCSFEKRMANDLTSRLKPAVPKPLLDAVSDIYASDFALHEKSLGTPRRSGSSFGMLRTLQGMLGLKRKPHNRRVRSPAHAPSDEPT
nr:sulfotransferase family 2 domain-containing protein [uncultured Cohaesibacter sp.]